MSVQAGTDPFNSALQRAKEIAAKIQGSKDVNPNNDTRKRSFNGEEPTSKRPMTDGSYMNNNPGGIQGNLKDEIRVPGSAIQYISGETLQKLQSQTACHIQISPSGPDVNAERAITLSGSRQCIENCKQRIRDIIHQYAPEAAAGGPPQGFAQSNMMEQMAPLETVDMLIPQSKVGLVIGRGGETIKDLAIQSGCKMNMIQDGPYVNAPEKPLRMHGTRFAINKARELVSGLMQQEQMGGNRPNNNNYNPMGGNRGPYEETRNFAVPRDYVGLVIGKQGDTIKRLQSETGANVQFNCTDPHAPGERYVIIQGNKNQVDEVESRLNDLLGKIQHKDHARGPNQKTVSYPVPANKCGLVIGKKGETISKMKEKTGAHIEMNKNSPHDAPVKQFTIKGTDDQIEYAKSEIAKIVGDDPYGSGGGNSNYNSGHGSAPSMYNNQPHPHHQGVNPQQAMPAAAYQQQMAYYQAYYQQQAAMQQAAMQQNPQASAPAPVQPAANTAPPQADQQSVQQQWAAYYQQLVQMYGAEQAQIYWTQLSQQQQQQQQQQ